MGSADFARHYFRYRYLLSFPLPTKMFQFRRFPLPTLYIQVEVAGHDSGIFKVSLFGDPRIEARLPAPRGLSQVTTSFIGSWCLGIHRSHLVACQKNLSTLQRCSRPLCSSQVTGGTTVSKPASGPPREVCAYRPDGPRFVLSHVP